MMRAAISDALRLIFQGIERLKEAFPNREFTIDGRLVGDIDTKRIRSENLLSDVCVNCETDRR